jgi:hypothetical protein
LSYKQLKENGGKFRKWFDSQEALPITDYTSCSFWKVTLAEPVVDAIVGMNGLTVQESDDDEDSSQSESEEETDLFKHISSLPENRGKTFYQYRS